MKSLTVFRAIASLKEQAEKATGINEKKRLLAKAEGMKFAMDQFCAASDLSMQDVLDAMQRWREDLIFDLSSETTFEEGEEREKGRLQLALLINANGHLQAIADDEGGQIFSSTIKLK